MSGPVRELTTRDMWDDRWRATRLPAEVRKGEQRFLDAITDVFDRNFPRGRDVSLLEIGGAPGQWAVYLHRHLGHQVALLDYSPAGLQVAEENFRRLGFPVRLVEGDMFDRELRLPPADVVLSLGLIEHFEALEDVIGAHLRWLKPGGLLAIGCPNFQGVNGAIKRWTAPHDYALHNVATMRIEDWSAFERRFSLTTLYKGYLGGFEPRLFKNVEGGHRVSRGLSLAFKALAVLLNLRVLGRLRGLNSRWWSGYALAIYRAPAR
ncbi:MAG: class I SAM-dependent methyltransferase [Solirubrobacterales bacterium]|nr:class I SAM-dependent methyltransferase [Solirubrobacterales bacterium]